MILSTEIPSACASLAMTSNVTCSRLPVSTLEMMEYDTPVSSANSLTVFFARLRAR